MNIEKGDYVTRKSHNNDTLFKVINIDNEKAYLKGVHVRLQADSLLSDLLKTEVIDDDFNINDINLRSNSDYFFLPAKILHIDGDEDYLEKCLKFYKTQKIRAIGKKISEDQIAHQINDLLKDFNPDIVVITGHDAYYKKNGDKSNLNNYQNSKNFIKAIKAARQYEKSHERLVIIAGACQSNYEELIKAGANFASSPKRINIHALDPAIIAASIALTEKSHEIDLVNILEKTRFGSDGLGGIITNGLMYVGYPR